MSRWSMSGRLAARAALSRDVEEFPDQFGAFFLGDDVAEAFDVHLGDSVPRCLPRVFAHAFRVGVAAAPSSTLFGPQGMAFHRVPGR